MTDFLTPPPVSGRITDSEASRAAELIGISPSTLRQRGTWPRPRYSADGRWYVFEEWLRDLALMHFGVLRGPPGAAPRALILSARSAVTFRSREFCRQPPSDFAGTAKIVVHVPEDEVLILHDPVIVLTGPRVGPISGALPIGHEPVVIEALRKFPRPFEAAQPRRQKGSR